MATGSALIKGNEKEKRNVPMADILVIPGRWPDMQRSRWSPCNRTIAPLRAHYLHPERSCCVARCIDEMTNRRSSPRTAPRALPLDQISSSSESSAVN